MEWLWDYRTFGDYGIVASDPPLQIYLHQLFDVPVSWLQNT